MTEILNKLEWLHDTLKGSKGDDATCTAALRFHVEDIAQALLDIAYTPDAVVREVVGKLIARSRRGMKDYGISMQDNKATKEEWINHMVEELLDAANYATRLKMEL